jgi:hypothetical protein
VDQLDNAIVISRFNQKELQRDLITLRSQFLNAQSYDELPALLEEVLKIRNKVSDKRLLESIKEIIDQLTTIKHGNIDIKKKVEPTETKVSE